MFSRSNSITLRGVHSINEDCFCQLLHSIIHLTTQPHMSDSSFFGAIIALKRSEKVKSRGTLNGQHFSITGRKLKPVSKKFTESGFVENMLCQKTDGHAYAFPRCHNLLKNSEFTSCISFIG